MNKKAIKTTAKTLLFLSLLSTYAVKYGFDCSAGIAKKTLGITESMTDYFFDHKIPKLGIADSVFDKSVAGVDWTLDQTIKLQKALNSKIK